MATPKPQPVIRSVEKKTGFEKEVEKLVKAGFEVYRNDPGRVFLRQDFAAHHNLTDEALAVLFDPTRYTTRDKGGVEAALLLPPASIKGTGENGLITEADALRALGR